MRPCNRLELTAVYPSRLAPPTGFDVPEIDRDFITKKLQTEFSCSPVYLSAEVAERYYNGFSNSILWPLFHCEPSLHTQRSENNLLLRLLLTLTLPFRPPRRDVF